jgi:pimeloyl-ACP methyl ester carboxylesterase
MNPLEQAARALEDPGVVTVPAVRESAPDTDQAEAVAATAHFFGKTEDPLFGIHYAPTGGHSRNHGVVLCPPLGWEYMRTHWAMRQIARNLVVAGFDVLRFDYYATGDSAGVGGQGSVKRWIADIHDAVAELLAASGAETASIVGVRLGATLASLAASTELAIDRLVMWDPVVDGNAYLRTLVSMNDQLLSERGNRRSISKAMMGDDLLGFPYPAALRAELGELDLLALQPHAATTVIASHRSAAYERLAASRNHVDLQIVDDEAAWEDVASSQSALLPRRIPRHIAKVLGGEA